MKNLILVKMIYLVGSVSESVPVSVFKDEDKAESWVVKKNKEVKRFKEVQESFYHINLSWIKENSYSQIKNVSYPNDIMNLPLAERKVIEKEIKLKNLEVIKENKKLSDDYLKRMKEFSDSYFKDNLSEDEYVYYLMTKEEKNILMYESEKINYIE